MPPGPETTATRTVSPRPPPAQPVQAAIGARSPARIRACSSRSSSTGFDAHVRHQGSQLADHAGGAAQPDVGLDPLLDRQQPALGQAGHLDRVGGTPYPR